MYNTVGRGICYTHIMLYIHVYILHGRSGTYINMNNSIIMHNSCIDLLRPVKYFAGVDVNQFH